MGTLFVLLRSHFNRFRDLVSVTFLLPLTRLSGVVVVGEIGFFFFFLSLFMKWKEETHISAYIQGRGGLVLPFLLVMPLFFFVSLFRKGTGVLIVKDEQCFVIT